MGGQKQVWGKGRVQLPSVEGHLGPRCGARYFTDTVSGLLTTALLSGTLVTSFYRSWRTAGISVNLPTHTGGRGVGILTHGWLSPELADLQGGL